MFELKTNQCSSWPSAICRKRRHG